jgi:hypothetical protein
MARSRNTSVRPDGKDLFDYARPRAPRRGRKPPPDTTQWIVTDDWPEHVPVTKTEVDVFENHFGDFFDKWLGPRS